jgi:hypothetical protein
MKLMKIKKKLQHNPTTSIVPYLPKRAREIRKPVLPRHTPPHPNHVKQTKTEPKKAENPYCPATHTSRVYKYTRTGPALSTAKIHTGEYVRDPAHQKIPTSPIDPIKEDGT